jgi:hypothetical protein
MQTDETPMCAEPLNPTQISTLVHLGAGNCPNLEKYLIQYGRVVLVDANPFQVDLLRRKAPGESRLRVIHCAVASEACSGFLYEYNLPEATSIHPATGLIELYPGLRLTRKTPIEPEGVAQLLSAASLDASAPNTIIIDLPGEEFPVLYTLARLDLLCQFQDILVHGGRIPLYEGALPLAEIAEWLRDEGFDLQEEDDSLDSDKPCARFRRNPLLKHNRELIGKVASLLEECSKIKEDLTLFERGRMELLVQVDKAEVTKSLAEQRSVVDRAEITMLHDLKAAAEQLADHRLVQVAQLLQDKEALEQRLQEQRTELEQLEHSRAAAENEAADQRIAIDQIEHTKAAAERLAGQFQAELAQLQSSSAADEKIAEDRLKLIEELEQRLFAAEHVAVEHFALIERLQSDRAVAENLREQLQALIEQLQRQKSAEQRLAEVRRLEVTEIQQALAIAERLARERLVLVQRLEHDKTVAEQLVEQLQAEHNRLQLAKTAADQLLEQRDMEHSDYRRSFTTRAEQIDLDYMARLEKLDKARVDAAATSDLLRSQLEESSLTSSEKIKFAEELLVKIETLESEKSLKVKSIEILTAKLQKSEDARIRVEKKLNELTDELVRAEAHVDLIKQLVLRDVTI